MNRQEKKRLRMLEEAAAKKEEEELPPGRTLYGRHRPYHSQERYALNKSVEAWRDLMCQYGWSDAEIDEEIEWDLMVAKRVEDAGLDEMEEMYDLINFLEVHGHEVPYPGPGHWDRGDSALPYLEPGQWGRGGGVVS